MFDLYVPNFFTQAVTFFHGVNTFCAYMLSCFSHLQLFVTLWTVACQTPMSMGLSRQEYWSGLPFPPPGELLNPGIESPVAPALAGGFFTTEPPGNLLRKMKVKESEVIQSCPTLCDPMDCCLPGSSVHGIVQARILEWVAISFSRRSSQPGD